MVVMKKKSLLSLALCVLILLMICMSAFAAPRYTKVDACPRCGNTTGRYEFIQGKAGDYHRTVCARGTVYLQNCTGYPCDKCQP